MKAIWIMILSLYIGLNTSFAQTVNPIAKPRTQVPSSGAVRRPLYPTRPVMRRKPPMYEFSYLGELGLSLKKSQLGEYKVNPKNSILELADTFSLLRASADLKWKSLNSKFTLRPLLDAYITQINIDGKSTSTQKSDADLLEAFWEWNNSPDSKLTFGLQSYQWGPAELLSPSNGIFHFGRDSRSLFFKEKGKGIFRWNLGMGQFWSLVAMLEAVDNREAQWVYGQSFENKKVIKVEKVSESNPLDYYGLTFGTAEFQKMFFGGYLNYAYTEGNSVYFDLRVTEDPQIYRPTQNRLGFDTLEIQKAANPVMLAVLGIRFEGDYDTRVEVIHNEGGYSKAELTRALSASQYPNPAFPINLVKLSRAGVELLQKQYLYLSHRIPDASGVQGLNLALRSLLAVQSPSGNFQFALDYGINDSLTWLSELTFTQATDDSEFSLAEKLSISLGLKKNF